jgi:hypothetical protein
MDRLAEGLEAGSFGQLPDPAAAARWRQAAREARGSYAD